ncbi:unnamed protein product [Chrysoparadoxa australica]
MPMPPPYPLLQDEIVIEASGDRDSSFEDMLEHLPPNEGRYALFDLDFNTKDGRPTSKLVFIAWAPDTAKIKTKMMYSGSKEALKSALVGVGIHVQANDQSDLDLEKAIIPAAQKFT